jgi:hypothetical protein
MELLTVKKGGGRRRGAGGDPTTGRSLVEREGMKQIVSRTSPHRRELHPGASTPALCEGSWLLD